MVYHWYISGSIFYTEGDSYLGRAKAQHRAAGAGQKGAAGGLPGGFPMGITWKNLGKYGNTWRKPKVFVSDVSLKVCVGWVSESSRIQQFGKREFISSCDISCEFMWYVCFNRSLNLRVRLTLSAGRTLQWMNLMRSHRQWNLLWRCQTSTKSVAS